MVPPCYRRPRRTLTREERDTLVAMRDAGVTWREIGRVFGKQDNACKRIYDRAKLEGEPWRADASGGRAGTLGRRNEDAP